MKEQMKKISFHMAIRMSILMSLCLALVGTLSSGHFTIPGYLLSFVASTIISLLIGLIIPVGKISSDVCKKLKMKPHSLPERCMSSLISNLIYTPLMTLIMVSLAYAMVMKQSGGMAQISFLPMFLKSLILTFIVGYVLIFIFMPLFLGQLMKKYGPGNMHP